MDKKQYTESFLFMPDEQKKMINRNDMEQMEYEQEMKLLDL